MSDVHPLEVALTGLTGELSRALGEVEGHLHNVAGAEPARHAIRVMHARISAVEARVELLAVANPIEVKAATPRPKRASKGAAAGGGPLIDA